MAEKVAAAKNASPRISAQAGGFAICSRRGMERMVRTLAVISSPR